MHKSIWLLLLTCAGCAKALPVQAPRDMSPPRPQWASNLAAQTDAIHACLREREAPRYVVFVEPLKSGATGITTIDAYDAIEYCAYLDGRIVWREPAEFTLRDVSAVRGALFSPGDDAPRVPGGQRIEELLERGQRVGWLYWPELEDAEPAASPGERP